MAAFGISVDKVEWVITAYMLVFAVMLPTAGWIADHFGYKRTYFLALAMFTFGSFLCGQAWNEDVLILSRIIQANGSWTPYADRHGDYHARIPAAPARACPGILGHSCRCVRFPQSL